LSSIRSFVFAGALLALSGVHFASAQNVANLTVVAGQGQVASQCSQSVLNFFQPITVKATDVNQNPVAGATITWAVSGLPQLPTLESTTTTTDANGLSTNLPSLVVTNNIGTTGTPYYQSNISATTANGKSVTFTETMSLCDTQGGTLVIAGSPILGGVQLSQASISGNSGTQLSSPVQILVAGSGIAGGGVPGVEIRLLPLQTSPSISCAPMGPPFADPGTVLTGPLTGGYNGTCYPVLGGSGTGQYELLVGGVPAGPAGTPLYLQQFGPYSFTVIPGTPAGMKVVSGNNQTAAPGAALQNLVAEVVDSKGNAVAGAQVTWTVTPNASLALSATTTVTDNNGQVSTQANFAGSAVGGVVVTVTLVSNPSISATFTETTTAQITTMTKVQGDGQSAKVNTAFATPLQVQLKSTFGNVPFYPVQFSVTGPATLSTSSPTTDATGTAQVTVTAGSNPGAVTVTATVGTLTQVFNLTVLPAGPTPTGMTKASGDAQSAIINTAFAAPLVVQVNSGATPVPNIVVSFIASGPITISSGTATTGANGQAQITVQAQGTTGSASVSASIAGFSVTFNLTVLPPGPAVTANSFLNGASGQTGFISPCSLATLSAPGLAPSGASSFSPAPLFGRLPYVVNGLSISFNNVPAPIVSVSMGTTNPQVTFQVPCETTPGSSVPVIVTVGLGTANVNVPVQNASPGIIESVNSDGTKRAVIVRDDGSFMDLGTLFPNPARRGENVRIYLTGLGPTIPAVGTNSIQDPNADLFGRDALVAGTVIVGLSGAGGVTVVSARQAPDLIGVYEIQFVVPSNAPTGDVGISVGIIPQGAPLSSQGIYSQTSKINIQ